MMALSALKLESSDFQYCHPPQDIQGKEFYLVQSGAMEGSDSALVHYIVFRWTCLALQRKW